MPKMTSEQRMELWGWIKSADRKTKEHILAMLTKELANGKPGATPEPKTASAS
jgi:hypothetical protein